MVFLLFFLTYGSVKSQSDALCFILSNLVGSKSSEMGFMIFFLAWGWIKS